MFQFQTGTKIRVLATIEKNSLGKLVPKPPYESRTYGVRSVSPQFHNFGDTTAAKSTGPAVLGWRW